MTASIFGSLKMLPASVPVTLYSVLTQSRVEPSTKETRSAPLRLPKSAGVQLCAVAAAPAAAAPAGAALSGPAAPAVEWVEVPGLAGGVCCAPGRGAVCTVVPAGWPITTWPSSAGGSGLATGAMSSDGSAARKAPSGLGTAGSASADGWPATDEWAVTDDCAAADGWAAWPAAASAGTGSRPAVAAQPATKPAMSAGRGMRRRTVGPSPVGEGA